MNPYTILSSGPATREAAALSARLTAWHDAMVAHERRLRAGATSDACDEECPHAEARTLWGEAIEVFGARARELTFLRSRAIASSESSEELIAPADVLSEAADSSHRSNESPPRSAAHRTTSRARSSERSLIATAEL